MTSREFGVTLTLAIIADDLTGALDAAAPFAGRGLRTEVALSPADTAAAIAAGAQVVSINTASREVGPDAARAAVAETLAALPEGTLLFKKIDSRLKGNIAAELSAFGARRLLVAPAIPDLGRVTQGGYVMGFGVDTPLPMDFPGALIPDIDTPARFHAALDAAGDALPVGARGLAEAIAQRMTRRAAAPAPLAGPRGIIVVGSRDPITVAQVAACKVPHVRAPNGIFADVPLAPVMLIQAVQGARPAAPEDVAASLARGLRTLPAPDTLFMTGGATAEAVLRALGIRTLHLLGECLPGIPVARAGGMTVAAKSGGFGTEDTLADIARRIAAP